MIASILAANGAGGGIVIGAGGSEAAEKDGGGAGAGGWGRDCGSGALGGGERSLGLEGNGASFRPCCIGGGGDLSFLGGGGDLSFLATGEGDRLLNLWSLGEREPARSGGGLLLLRGGGERDLERLLGGDLERPGRSRSGGPDEREMDRLLLRICGGGGVRDRARPGGGGDREKRRLVGT